ncbi:MAG: transposase [Sedimenticolaceae bacterium]
MARSTRACPAGVPQHIIQRGNNRQPCFACEEDLAAYANWLEEAAAKFQVAIHAWAFMTNHVHLLATPSEPDGLSRMMQSLGRRYVRYFNYMYRRSGTLWEGRFKSCVIDAEAYLLLCQRYIELNPVRAGMVEHPGKYRWSSYAANAQAKPRRLWTPHDLWLRLGRTHCERAERYREMFRGQIDPELLNQVRTAVNKGLALGNDQFRREIERLTGVRVSPKKRGPKPSAPEMTDGQQEFLL